MTQSSLSLFDLKPGNELLGRYKIVAPHRENGMSAAFEVTEGGERLELQAFPASLFEDPAQARAFAASLERWEALESDALVRLRGVEVLDDGAVLTIADFPGGRMLRDVMRETPVMEAPGVLALARSVLDGLGVAHEARLAHGDVKPTTVFVDGEGRGALVDGGVTPGLWAAKHLGTRTALIGTPYYAPLEQFGGDSPDERSDLYNLATVLYELLTGAMPWRGRSYIEVFQSKMQPEAPPMRSMNPDVDVDPALERAIAKALRGKRLERHGSVEDFRAALDECAVA